MGLFSRFRKGRQQQVSDEVTAATQSHLTDFITTRRGVEAFIELPTTMTKTTLLLIAYDGEWTRRSVESVDWARRFAAMHSIPSYDAGVVGYPKRMRDYNAKQKLRPTVEDNPAD
ncbi:MAG: hypothetical protein FWG47_02280 [Propionibacteriaceae bacterium]|nr:hypothetical protein [Propionibacteriaceae bacterium]